MTEKEFDDKIQSRNISVCVVGIGRIGLPTALSFANSGFFTYGVDINKNLVGKINEYVFPLKDEPGFETIFDDVINSKKFIASTDFKEGVSYSDVILLALPTSVNSSNIPDYSVLESVGKQLHEHLRKGSLVVVESTVEPGFIENTLIPIIEGDDNSLKVGRDFIIGVCPEAANPGTILNNFATIPRLIGAVDEKTRDIIAKIYSHVFAVDLIFMPDCKTANAAKLITNVFRDLNIAFVNELAILFEKAGIDIKAVLDAANTKYNFQAHYPGSGVGGPCLPVNSYYLINFAKSLGLNTLKIVEEGRKINESMPDHVIELLKDAFNEANKSLSNSTVLVLGVSYKPNIKDVQVSPSGVIVEKLQSITNVLVYDPYFEGEEVLGITVESDLIETLPKVDAIIIATPHDEFKDLKPSFLKSRMCTGIVIDSARILDQVESKKVGLVYRGIGRGKI